MKDILQQISTIPGIAGTLVYDRDGKILGSEFPRVYEPSTLQRVVSILSGDIVIVQELVRETGALDLKYTGGRVIVKAYAGGSILALCTASINSQLLNLALTQATRRLEKGPVEPPAPKKPVAPATSPLSPEAADRLKRALVGRVGPIGELLFTQIHGEWVASARPGSMGLEDLVGLLAREIEDRNDQQSFKNEARKLIS